MEPSDQEETHLIKSFGCYARAFTCDCGKNLKEYTIYKETGEEVNVCGQCAAWWRRVDPTVTIVSI